MLNDNHGEVAIPYHVVRYIESATITTLRDLYPNLIRCLDNRYYTAVGRIRTVVRINMVEHRLRYS